MRIEIIGLNALRAEIRGIMHRVDNLLPGIEKGVKRYLDDVTQQRYSAEKSPDGVPWKALDPAYKRSKRKRESVGANRILVLDDIMRRSYKTVATKAFLDYGTNDFKARWHQEGRGRLPARPHLGLNQNDVESIGRIAMRFLENG